jgi:hypothetical protein
LIVALALGVESVLTTPTVPGDLALRHVLRLHPRTLAGLDHDAYVQAVTFSPDGTRVATGSEDGSARAFGTAPHALVRRAIDVMTRPLNSAELRRYSLPPNCRHIEQWELRRESATTERS